MALTLNTNVASLQTQQYLNTNTINTQNALQQLSSGNRLNGPADDPADYAIAYKLGVKSASISTSINNGNQALSMLQVAQGGITQIGSILTQLKQIATEAASSNTDSSDLGALQTQVAQLETEINNIAAGTQYGGVAVLAGGNTIGAGQFGAAETTAGIDSISFATAAAGNWTLTTTPSATTGGGVTMTMSDAALTLSQTIYVAQPAPNTVQQVNFSQLGISMEVNSALTGLAAAANFTVTAGTSSFQYQVGAENQTYAQINVGINNFGFGQAGGLNLSGNVSTQGAAQTFMTQIDLATTWLNGQAGSIGASQDEIQYQVANLQSMNTNTQSAESTIKDTDYAASMSNFSQAQVASQASVAMLAQANAIPQEILTLIKG
jgi:flagellin